MNFVGSREGEMEVRGDLPEEVAPDPSFSVSNSVQRTAEGRGEKRTFPENGRACSPGEVERTFYMWRLAGH